MGSNLDSELLRERIADIRRSLPAHSVPPAMLIELEDLEEQLEAVLAGAGEGKDASA